MKTEHLKFKKKKKHFLNEQQQQKEWNQVS